MRKTSIIITAIIALTFPVFAASTVVTSISPVWEQTGYSSVIGIGSKTTTTDNNGKNIEDGVQFPGWPREMGCKLYYKPTRGMVFYDINNDGTKEIIASSTNGMIYVWDYLGNLMPGWPVYTGEMNQTTPAVGDLDGDGTPEIVQFMRGWAVDGLIYAFEPDGSIVPGFPISPDGCNVAGSPCLADLDNDGDLEIIAGGRMYPYGYLYVYNHDGSLFPGNWPATLDHVPTGTAAVGDLDGDGSKDIVYLSYESVYAFHSDGTLMDGWPISFYPEEVFSYQSPAIADFDGDGTLETAIVTHGNSPSVRLLAWDGTILPGWPRYLGSWSYCPPTIADIDGDGEKEILCGRSAGVPGNNLFAFDMNGNNKPGFPAYTQCGVEGPIIVADINDDGEMEIIHDSNIKETSSGEGYLYALDSSGNPLPDWPLRPEGFTYMNGSVVGDINGDGIMEVGCVSYGDYEAYVNIWSLTGEAGRDKVEWGIYHANSRHDGLYRGALRSDITITVSPDQISTSPGNNIKINVWLNNGSENELSIDAWIDVYTSEGLPLPISPAAGPSEFQLPPFSVQKLMVTQQIPITAPEGNYTLTFKIGEYNRHQVIDTDVTHLEITQ